MRCVVLGGVAERMLGSPRLTDDFDICPETSRDNLTRLASMLNQVEARRAPPCLEEEGFPPVEPRNEASFGAHTSLALLTRHGKLDVWIRPDGTAGYDDLFEDAIHLEFDGLPVAVVSLEDSIRIKRTVGSVKYLGHIPLLQELQRQRREQGLD